MQEGQLIHGVDGQDGGAAGGLRQLGGMEAAGLGRPLGPRLHVVVPVLSQVVAEELDPCVEKRLVGAADRDKCHVVQVKSAVADVLLHSVKGNDEVVTERDRLLHHPRGCAAEESEMPYIHGKCWPCCSLLYSADRFQATLRLKTSGDLEVALPGRQTGAGQASRCWESSIGRTTIATNSQTSLMKP